MLRIERRVISKPSRPIYATPVRERVVGATVEVPSDAYLEWSVEIKNTGYRDIDLGAERVLLKTYFGETLSAESGDPQTDMDTWASEATTITTLIFGKGSVLKKGETKTYTDGHYVSDLRLEESKTYDVGVIVEYMPDTTETALDSTRVEDAIKIVPTIMLSIESGPNFSWS